MAEPVRVAIVNDYEVVVRGLAAMLAPYADRVRVVDTAVGELPSGNSDVVLYDTFAAAPAGPLNSAEILLSFRAKHLVVYTWPSDSRAVGYPLDEDVSAYLAKTLSAGDLVDALERVCAGEVVGAMPTVSTVPEPGDWPGRREGLSARESEIVVLIVEGLSNEQIADRAYLSINTVKSYIRTAYRKIKVTSRPQALLWGIDNGFRLTSTATRATTMPADE